MVGQKKMSFVKVYFPYLVTDWPSRNFVMIKCLKTTQVGKPYTDQERILPKISGVVRKKILMIGFKRKSEIS